MKKKEILQKINKKRYIAPYKRILSEIDEAIQDNLKTKEDEK